MIVMLIRSESGDDYGPILLEKKPSDTDLRKYLLENFSYEFPDKCLESDDNDDDFEGGPGIFGSYLHVNFHDVEVTKI